MRLPMDRIMCFYSGIEDDEWLVGIAQVKTDKKKHCL